MRYDPMIRLKIKRMDKGLTQKQLSDIVGIRQNLLSCYERGVYFPRKSMLIKLARALGCEINEII